MRITLSGVYCVQRAVDVAAELDALLATVRSFASENTWKPPESVSIGPSHRVNACSPPSARTILSPGRRYRWYALREHHPPRRVARTSSDRAP